jgi:RsiW-degrading membrane proteinase PrsW (M82 family)
MTQRVGISTHFRQLSTGAAKAELLPPYSLSSQPKVVIGRDPTCEIALDPYLYTGVSRRHSVLRLVHPDKSVWEICDLNSANGTFVNGKAVTGCKTLENRDRVQLGANGPEFVIEDDTQTLAIPPSPPQSLNAVTFSQLFPIAATGRDLTQKAYLFPATVTIVFVVLMFAAIGEPAVFNFILASYLAGTAYYFIYRLCGKPKPWWVLFGSGLLTFGILMSPLALIFILFFRGFLPGNLSSLTDASSFPILLIRMFFGAGLMEELLKAVPLLSLYALGFSKRLSVAWKRRIGITEPLDGILLGTASAIGFTLTETLGQYVPEIVSDFTLQGGSDTGQLVGLQLLIPRIIGSVAGHMAYSGYLGYFIGLSVLKPAYRFRILGIGYLSASLLHALWNVTGFYSSVLLAVVGIISYAFLAAAILKARQLSPTRENNFATHLKS